MAGLGHALYMARLLRIQFPNARYHVTCMELLARHGGMNQREFGGRMGIDHGTVSMRTKRFGGRAGDSL